MRRQNSIDLVQNSNSMPTKLTNANREKREEKKLAFFFSCHCYKTTVNTYHGRFPSGAAVFLGLAQFVSATFDSDTSVAPAYVIRRISRHGTAQLSLAAGYMLLPDTNGFIEIIDPGSESDDLHSGGPRRGCSGSFIIDRDSDDGGMLCIKK
ncbi:hypothetical protein ACLOJK_016023 [Asimina triloba]